MTIHTYKTYSFKDKDPIIDKLRTIISDQKVSYREISKRSRVSESCLYAWFHGATKRPQHASIMATARALGWDYELVKRNGKDKP